jgi:hypothetical protein
MTARITLRGVLFVAGAVGAIATAVNPDTALRLERTDQ